MSFSFPPHCLPCLRHQEGKLSPFQNLLGGSSLEVGLTLQLG